MGFSNKLVSLHHFSLGLNEDHSELLRCVVGVYDIATLFCLDVHVVREISSFTCVSCNETNVVASLRYRLILTVSDNTDTAAFLAFDMEMVKLTNIQPSEAAQIVGIGADAQVDTELPQSLAEIVGKT
ncbi:OB-fold-like protein [Raphanus sativus]|nr:OB-fold-like protein [Raphanus sativus]